MTRMIPCCLLAVAVLGCDDDPTTAAVGRTCLPRDEFHASFPGFGADEITIETANDDCAAEAVCLVYEFQGRVSCPYGQTSSDLVNYDADDPHRCVVPRRDSTAVDVEVRPQLRATAGHRGVYCSALCADANGNRDDGRSYHDCPKGFHCEALMDTLLISSQNLGGSYCMRNDTPTKAELSSTDVCTLATENCGNARPFQ